MDCSLREFIELGRLGPLQVGESRVAVTHALGNPQYWESGQRETSWEQCDIWEYASLQIVFSSDDRIEILRLVCDVRDESQLNEDVIEIEPLRFSDHGPHLIAELGRYSRYLEEHAITFESQINEVGKTIIRTRGSSAKFSRHSRFVESQIAGHNVWSELSYLVTITTST